DTNSGLVGPIIVTARGKANPDGSPKDVDRQFVAMFSVLDENKSALLADNIRRFTKLRGKAVEAALADEDFGESNLMHTINGYGFNNLPGLRMRAGERVRWYVMGMGTEVDLHTPHWHGNTLLDMGMRTDVTGVLPMQMRVLDMVPENAGTWLFHCTVNDHLTAGMSSVYRVLPGRAGSATAAAVGHRH
ncbi:MAG: multicopper oxidase domain-containing protein, partial [Gemmatimonadaceae bacterium]